MAELPNLNQKERIENFLFQCLAILTLRKHTLVFNGENFFLSHKKILSYLKAAGRDEVEQGEGKVVWGFFSPLSLFCSGSEWE